MASSASGAASSAAAAAAAAAASAGQVDWAERWDKGMTGWKWEEKNLQHERNWRYLESKLPGLRAGQRVLVPLCGDTPLIPFLADRGFRVEGIEVVPKAVAALLALMPARKFTRTGPEDGSVVHASADGLVTVHQYDFFRFRAREPFDLVYDRGALVAVQPSERERYADVVATAMGPGAFLFQDVIDRGGDKKSGPPFEVVESELRALYEKRGLEMIDHQVGASREGMGVTHYYLLRKRTE